jgi:hypothetical protein
MNGRDRSLTLTPGPLPKLPLLTSLLLTSLAHKFFGLAVSAHQARETHGPKYGLGGGSVHVGNGGSSGVGGGAFTCGLLPAIASLVVGRKTVLALACRWRGRYRCRTAMLGVAAG